ncbi:bile acid:sodium symporter family protein [Alistipes ihumii]|nr:transporter [Alistipes ihumii]
MLPIAMIVGGVFHSFFASLAFLTPYLIFLMLLVPYCKLSLGELRIAPLHVRLLLVQIAGGLGLYLALAPIDPLLAQGTFICVLAPTATSAAVVTGMLGGSVASLATYCLLSNMVVALISPVVFSFVGSQVSLPLLDSLLRIGRQMIPLLILPFVAALALQRFWPRAYRALRQRQSISFYLWAVSLTIVMGNTTSFLIRQDSSRYGDELLLAGASLVACVCQFVIGRRIGRKYDLKISGAQGLGQKNTVLAIWMAQTYLLPIASVGPAAYVVWQNVINSWQLWKKRRSEAEQQI